MKQIHPLKRKSVKPSISTVRGMLPGKQFRALDAAMQNLRTAALRLEWRWKNVELGWVCAGLFEDSVLCELQPTQEPLVGSVLVRNEIVAKAMDSSSFPSKFKPILEAPYEKTKSLTTFEFILESSKQRDMYSDFVEALEPFLMGDEET